MEKLIFRTNNIVLILTMLLIILHGSCIKLSKSAFAQEPQDYFKIIVVDEETGRGVPLVELKTTNNIYYYTDNNGVIAFNEPGLMDREVYFSITSHGYRFPPDFSGNPGTTFKVTRGDSALIKIERKNIAERMYRFTGEGLYHHSLRVGVPVPLKQPVINAEVTGMDGSMVIPYKGKIFWTWGDTNKLSGFLGHFAISGATSEFPENGGLDPDIGIDLNFFVDKSGFSKEMCPVSGPGMVWNFWLGVLPDDSGKERLILHYGRMKDLGENYESGLAIFNDEKALFEPFHKFENDALMRLSGHALVVNVKGKDYYYFSYETPYTYRVPADLKHIMDINLYEAYTCLKKGTRYKGALSEIDRDEAGGIIYSWKAETDPVGGSKQKELIDSGLLKDAEGWVQLCNVVDGKKIKSQAGSVYWNDYRKKWVMIMEESEGTSNLGEIWYAEGDTPVGPWVYAKKIVTHDKYSFYNPTQHPFFDKEGGRYIYFDGTYSNSFSGTEHRTPRYDYNQIMYRLDLNDSRLYLPAPVYSLFDNKGKSTYLMREAIDSLNLWQKIEEIPFFAIPNNRKLTGLVPVYIVLRNGKRRLKTNLPDKAKRSEDLIFYGLPVLMSVEEKISGTWECNAEGYLFSMDLSLEGNEVRGKIPGQSLVFNKGTISNDTIILNIKDTEAQATYILTIQITDGKLYGKYKGEENNDSGSLTGQRKKDSIWDLFSPQSLVPLYEYKDNDGKYYYSVDSERPKMKRSEKPICKVWRNPSTTMALDFEAKPVPYAK